MMNWAPVLSSVGYAALGVIVMVVAFAVVDLLTPGKLWNEILNKKNTAVAILAAGFAIAVAIIVASAIH
jgi:putative membrane protein